ncbi:amino acid adenylation domain-containing protein (plasmid) [Tistrella mobilis]|uniref:amino acid adenylation domain-containing protein n=1 Tax=Tistrella mobilis TaxID=171437 RepID=UPI003557BCD4
MSVIGRAGPGGRQDAAAETIAEAAPVSLLPLSGAQAGIWADLTSAGVGPAGYNIADRIDLDGPLAPAALCTAIRLTDQATEAVRLRFTTDETGTPWQWLAEAPGRFDFAVVDLSDADAPDLLAQEAFEALQARPFDTAQGPLCRHQLLRLAPDRHRWIRCYHHLILDGQGGMILAGAVGRIYTALIRGEPVPDPDLPAFTDHLAREAAHAAGTGAGADAAWWRSRLAGLPAAAGFRPAATATARFDGRIASVTRPLGAARLEAMDRVARAHGLASRSSLALALFLVLLGRVAGTDTPVCNTPLGNRMGRAERRTPGEFAYTVPTGTRIDGTESLAGLARRLDAMTRRDLRHMRLAPMRWPEAGFIPDRPASRGALFNAMDLPATYGFDGLQVRVADSIFGELHDVMACLRTYGAADASDMQWSFPPARIDRARVESLAAAFEAMLDAALADPTQPVDHLPAGDLPSPVDTAGTVPPQPAVPLIDTTTRTALEAEVTRLFAGLLDAPGLGADDDLTAHGLHSLRAIRAVAPLTRLIGREVTVTDILGHPSAAALVGHLFGRLETMAAADESRHAEVDSPTEITSFRLPARLEGQWLARRDAGPGTSYSIGLICDLPTGTTAAALEDALRRLLDRHPALHSTFAEGVDGQVMQRIGPVPPIRLAGYDDAAEMLAPFDPVTGPLIRFGWEAGQPERLRVVVDHLVFDGESRAVFQRELTALLTGQPLPPAPPVDAGGLDEAAEAAARAFWAPRLARLPERALAAEPDPVPPGEGRRAMIRLAPETTRALHGLTGRGATPTAIWTAIATTALWRILEDTQRLSAGIAFAGRSRRDTTDAIGCFVNLLPVVVDPTPGEALPQLARRIGREISQVLTVQDYPLSRLAADWAQAMPARGPAPVDLVCTLENDLSALEAADISFATGKFPLLIGLMWQGDAAALNIEYDPSRFGSVWIGRLQTVITRLIAAAAADPATPVDRLDLLDAGDRAVIAAANGTEFIWPRDGGLGRQLDQVLRADPDRIVLADDGRTLTARDLRARLGGVAAALAAAGVEPGAPVALAVERDPDGLTALMGIIWAGNAFLPLAATFPVATARELLATAGCTVLVADGAGLERWAALAPEITLIPLPTGRADLAPAPRDPEDPACLLYTSGSTGLPKGVVVPHRAILRLAYGGYCPAGGCMAQAAPMAFDAISLELWAPLLNHGRVRVLPATTMFDPPLLERRIRDDGIDTMWITASLFNQIVDERPGTFAGLKRLMTGGEVISPDHVRRVMAACPGVALYNGYGPTENGTFTTIHRITAADLEGGPVTIGRPVPGTRVHIVDSRGQPLPIGVWGELVTAGDGLATGYAGRPDLTAKSFVTLSGLDEPLVYRTGDRARWRTDGTIDFGGRRDGQLKIRGQRIETAAVEAILTAQPGVRDAVVAGIGHGADQSLAALVAADEADEPGWRAAIAARLPAYMVPERFRLVDRLPVNANGKADRRQAAAMLSEAAPVARPAGTGTGFERAVIIAFESLFPGVRIGIETDFFDLGGHSLAAMRLSALLQVSTGRRPGLAQIMAARSVRAIAALLDRLPAAAVEPAIPRATGQEHPLSPGQLRLWVLHRLYPRLATYSVPMLLALDGPLDPDALDRALIGLETRHHALRTRFIARPNDADGVRQIVAAPGALTARRLRLDAAAADQAIAREIARPFDLAAEPLARALLIRIDAHHHRLLLVLHHAIADGWSLPVLLRDLGRLYAGAVDGRPDDQPPPVRQLADIAVWQRARAAGAEGRALIERWQSRLTPPPQPLRLPADHPRPAVRNFAGEILSLTLPMAATAAVDRMAAAAEVTPFTVLTALLQALLHRLTGARDIALGLLVAGRGAPVPDDLVGFLVNTVVLRQSVDPAARFADHLAITTDRLAEASADQDAPFEAVLQTLALDRDPARNPLFDVLVTWQDDMPAMPAMAGLTVRPLDCVLPFAKFDLSFHFQRDGGRIRLHLEYATELFETATVRRLADRLAVLAAAPGLEGSAIGALPLMTDIDRAALARWNDTARTLDTTRPLPALRHAGDPSAPALIAPGLTLDNQGFDRRVGGLARRLLAAGVQPGDVVALALPRSPDLLIAVHAVLAAGAAWCPLGPDLPPQRRAHMIEDLGDPWFLSDAAHGTDLPADRLILIGDDLADAPVVPAGPDALAYVLFTSGSTGRPKGVEITRGALANRILWMQQTFPIKAGDVILQKTPAGFDVSVWELVWWAWSGAAVAVPPPGIERDPQALAAAIRDHRVTVIHFVPAMLRAFLEALDDGRIDPADLATLRLVFASGEALDAATAARFDRLLHARFGTALHNLYGPTEATIDVTWQPCTPWDPAAKTVPIGRPVANTRVLILDRAGRDLPPGVAGEIVLAGPQVARGYRGRPDLTADRFRPDPEIAGARVYHTGDLGRWTADGVVEYLGRIDDQVKIGGVRLEPAEVEAALDACPGVVRGLVRVGRRDGLAELEAWVMGAAELTPAGLRAALADRLPAAMIPTRWFRIDQVPLSPNGKVDRKALSGVPLAGRPAVAAAPAGHPAEAEIARIWRAVLPPEAEFGPEDGFFEAGGSSLMLLRLHDRLEARWPGRFSLAGLFAASTIAAQAALLDDGDTATGATATAATDGAIAIIGIGLRVAGAEDLAGFWQDVAAGADRVGPPAAARLGSARHIAVAAGIAMPATPRDAAWLDDIDGFDARRFRFSPADAALLDPEQRLFLETAQRALEDAGLGGAALKGARVAVHVGGNANPLHRQALRHLSGARLEQAFALNVPSNIATRLGFLNDWHGPASLVDTACSSGLVAVDAACRDLIRGTADLAIAGAARLILVPQGDDQRMTIESSTGRTHAFAEGADGTGAGEGAIALVLKPLARALADGDPVHGVILATAVNQDGASSGAAAPNPIAQAEVIRTAWDRAGVPFASVSYIEAHGTGTRLGDPIEIEGLTRAAGPVAFAEPAMIGSGKGNYGHLDNVAGALGLVRAVAALAHDTAPPQPFFDRPNPAIDFARAPVRVAARATRLPDRGTPRRAGVSSFGLSGINAHAVIEAAPARPAAAMDPDGHAVIVLSAGDRAALGRYARALHDRITADAGLDLAGIACTLTQGRSHLAWRFAVAVPDRAALLAALDRLGRGDDQDTAEVATGRNIRHQTVAAWHADPAAAAAAARAVLAGAVPVWPDFLPARRHHLPPAPFSRIPCRIELPAKAANTDTATTFSMGWTAFPGGRALALPLADPAFWPVAEHRLAGRPTLVGMAIPALVAADRGPGTVLRNLVWRRPLHAGSGEASLVIARDGSVTAGHATAEGGWAVAAEARLETSSAPHPSAVDLSIDGLIALDLAPFDGAEGVMQVGPRWDCRQAIWLTPDRRRAVARLALPAAAAADRRLWPWHPALLDIAASLLAGAGEVPREVAAIHVLAPLPDTVMARADRRPDGLVDIRLADAAGRPCLLIDGLRFVAADGRAAPELLAPVWVPAPLHPTPLPAGGCLVRNADDLAAAPADAALILQLPTGPDLARRTADLLKIALARPGTRRIAVTGAGTETDPDRAAVAGLVIAAAHETRHQDLRYLDVDDDAAPAAVAAEWAAAVPERFSLWRDGLRHIRRLDPIAADGAPAWPDHGVAVVTGGTGGFAAALAEALNHGGRVALALLARRATADDTLATAIARIEARGGRVRLFATDITDQAALAATLAQVRTDLGPITAVVHMAGIADGAMLAVRDMAGFDAVMAPKIQGARNLDALTRNDPVTAFVVFASLTGLVGAAGHTAYAAANAWLDGFARRRRAAGLPALAIDWCALADQGMAARAGADRAAGAPVIFPAQAVGAMTGALSTGTAQVVVLPAGLATTLTAPQPAHQPQPEPASKPEPADLATRIARIWAEVLGHDTVGADDDFFDLGGDSLAGLDIAERLTAETGQPVTLQLLFDHTTPRALAARLAPEAAEPAPTTIPAPTQTPPTQTPPTLAHQIAAIWAEVLGHKTVSVTDDFFDLGGDSLSGMEIADLITARLGQTATLALLFDHTTPAALAAALTPPAALAATLNSTETTPDPAPADPRRAPAGLDAWPLAWEQRAVVETEALAGMGTAFNLPHEIDLPGDVDIDRLRAAVAALIRRHAALRTGIIGADHAQGGEGWPGDDDWYGGDDWRMVAIDAAIVTPALAIQPIAHPVGTAPAAPIRPFSTDGGPMARWSLHRDPAGRLVLVFDIHHSMSDAQGVEILLTELAALYQGRDLPPVQVDLRDYGWWSARHGDAALRDARAWWEGIFPATPHGRDLPRLDLPADRPRPPVHGHDAAATGFELPPALSRDIRALASRRRTTPFTVLLTGWAILLSRLTGRDDITVALPVNTRATAGFDGVVGMHAALVPVRMHVPADGGGAALLAHIRDRQAGALSHHALSLGRMLAEFQAPAMPERSPLSEVSISYMNHAATAAGTLDAGGFRLRGLTRADGKNDLSVFIADRGEGFGLVLEYDTGLFDAARIEAFGPMLQRILAGLTADPDQPVGLLPLLDDETRGLLAAREAAEGLSMLDDRGQPVPPGVWGRLHRLGDDGWQPTGDRARWRLDLTAIETGGRIDRLTLWQGHLLDPALIEAQLSGLPGVAALRILPRPGRLVAAITAAGLQPDPAHLRRAAGAILPPVLVPGAWHLLDTLPEDDAALAAGVAATPSLEEAAEAATERLTTVLAVVSDVLGRPVTDPAADFHALGGHSLLAMRVVNRLEAATGIRIPMRAFFADASMAGIARSLGEAASEATDAAAEDVIPPGAGPGAHPASHGQQRLYLLQQMQPESPAWLMLFVLPAGAVDARALRLALDRLSARHATLRTGFATTDDGIVQLVAAEAPPPLVVDDLRHRTDGMDEALRLARHEAATPFDLAAAPLFRARLIRVGDEESLLLLVLHHIVGDGWSSRILLAELATLYHAATEGRGDPLPPLPVSYADYARWQKGHDWQAALDGWRDRLAGAPDAIALPTDRPPRPDASGRGATVRRELPAEVLAGLSRVARRHNTGLAAVGLALFAAVLYRLSRQGDMVIGMGVAGRDRAETEGLIGFFVNVLPIRLQLDDDTGLGQLIDLTRDRLAEALDRRELPFDRLVRALAPGRAGGRQPLANVIFEYQRFDDVKAATTEAQLPPPANGGRLGSAVAGLVDAATAKHDLILFFEDGGDRARFSAEYDTDLFDAATIEAWTGYLLRIATAVAASPDEI